MEKHLLSEILTSPVDYMLGSTLDGVQFLNLLRQRLGKPVNAVLLTGDTSSEFIRKAADCDWPVLFKPVGAFKLISSLEAQGGNHAVTIRLGVG